MIEDMKSNIIRGEKEMLSLSQRRDELRRTTRDKAQSSLKMTIDQNVKELNEINMRTAKLKGELARDRNMSDEQQVMISDKQKAISRLGNDISDLALQDVEVERKRNEATRLAEELENEQFERVKLEQ